MQLYKSRLAHIRRILDRISYKDWALQVVGNSAGIYLRVEFTAFDFGMGEEKLQSGRHWLIPFEASDSAIVQTVFKAILTAEEHEARESFLYRGLAIFGPHFDVEQLAALAVAKVPTFNPALDLA